MKPVLLHLIVWLCIAIVAVSGYGYWYTIIADKSVAVAELERQIERNTTASARAASVRSTLAELSDDESVVQTFFVPETGIVPFINDLEERARALGTVFKVRSVSTGTTATRPTLILLITVEGNFDAVMRTVGAIEYAPYHLALSQLTITENGKDAWRADLTIIVGSVSTPAATSTPEVLKTFSVRAPSYYGSL